MKRFACFFSFALALAARADLILVQNVDGISIPGSKGANQVVITLKGNQARIDSGSMASVIVDGKTGQMMTLMHEQKKVMRISADKAKAMAEMVNKAQSKESKVSKLVATGKTETVDGMETELYSADTPQGKATYWIAKNYPHAQEILAQMQALQPGPWNLTNTGIPDFRDFPGLPVKTVLDFGGRPITSTLVSAKLDPVPDSAFAVPAGYSDFKLPEILSGGRKKSLPEPSVSATPAP